MIVLADNDVLLKLAQCNLFTEFTGAFGVAVDDVRILRAARFSIQADKLRKRIGKESFARLSAFLEAVTDIFVEPDPILIAALNEQTDKNIDAGEAVLFAVCPLIADSVIVTGDKKSLRGLKEAGAEDEVCGGVYHALTGRIICFEQILTRILAHVGFEAIRDKLIRGRECDGGLALWLGSELDADESTFTAGLTSYLNELRQTTGSLLMQ